MNNTSGSNRHRTDLRFILAATLAVLMIVLESRSDLLQSARVALYMSVRPVIEIAQVPSKINSALQRGFADRELLRERIQTVSEENRQLRQRVIELENQELRSKWLAELLEVREKLEYPVLPANLVSVQLLPMTQKVVVDRGSEYDVYVGQPVLDHHGLLGQVTEVTPVQSAVTLITDANHSVPVRIQRNGLLAIAHGLGRRDELTISGIRSAQDVVAGDVLITSGLGNRFPPGYPVAEIFSIEGDLNSPFVEITATPLATVDPDHEVLMVWNPTSSTLDTLSSLSLNETQGN